MKRPIKLLAVVPLAVLVWAGVAALRPAKIDLVIDNGLSVPVAIEGVGSSQVVVPPRSTRRLEGLRAGKLELAAIEQGGEGRRFTLSQETIAEKLGDRLTYVWNVAGATPHYWIVGHGYGTRKDEEIDPRKFEPEGQLFALPPGLKPEVDVMFPEELRVSKGTTEAVLRGLFSAHFVEDGRHEAGREPELDPRMRQMLEEAVRKAREDAGEPRSSGFGKRRPGSGPRPESGPQPLGPTRD